MSSRWEPGLAGLGLGLHSLAPGVAEAAASWPCPVGHLSISVACGTCHGYTKVYFVVLGLQAGLAVSSVDLLVPALYASENTSCLLGSKWLLQ